MMQIMEHKGAMIAAVPNVVTGHILMISVQPCKMRRAGGADYVMELHLELIPFICDRLQGFYLQADQHVAEQVRLDAGSCMGRAWRASLGRVDRTDRGLVFLTWNSYTSSVATSSGQLLAEAGSAASS